MAQRRRRFLRSTAGLASVAVLGSASGCVDSVPVIGSDSSAIEPVPESASAVAYADLDVVRRDEGTRTLANTYLDQQSEYEWYDGPSDVEDYLSDVEDRYDIDPSKVHQAVGFVEYGGEEYSLANSQYWGVIVNADLSTEDIVEGLEELYDYAFDETDHSGVTVFEPESDRGVWVGALSAQRAVVGREEPVKDTIEVTTGEEAPLDTDLRQAYADTRDAPVRFVSTVPGPDESEAVPAETTTNSGETVDLSVLDDVSTLEGSVYRSGNVRGATTTMTATDGDTAEELADVVTTLRDSAADSAYQESVGDLIGDIQIQQNGSTVTTSIEKEVSALESIIEETTGPDEESRAVADTPVASFSFDYEAPDGRGTLTITHDGGDTIPRRELYVRGSGFAAVSGVDQSAPGRWRGTTSATIDGQPAVVAGDSVTVGVVSDYEISVIWQSVDGTGAATLGRDTGPDA